jgi:hypothetical protein
MVNGAEAEFDPLVELQRRENTDGPLAHSA